MAKGGREPMKPKQDKPKATAATLGKGNGGLDPLTEEEVKDDALAGGQASVVETGGADRISGHSQPLRLNQ